jgi:hypothetical protein
LLAGPEKLSAFSSLTELQWWLRIWVVPEITLPKERIVTFGPMHASWEMLLLSSKHVRTHWIRCCWAKMHLLEDHRAYLNGLRKFFQIVSDFEEPRERKANEENTPLLFLLWTYRNRRASDPRDMIFSHWSLGFDGDTEKMSESIRPDYCLTEQEVYRNVSIWFIKRQRNLDILFGKDFQNQLHRHGSTTGASTWIPTYGSGSM